MALQSAITKDKVMLKGAEYGAIAGFIATWSISTAIAASEFEIGLPVSTFYSIMGAALGMNSIIAAAYLGMALHLLTGTILGAIVGSIAVRLRTALILDPYHGTVLGMGAGFAIWLLLFLPITALLIQPAAPRITSLLAVGIHRSLLSDDLDQFTRSISISAIAFHMIWGGIFGFIASSLLRIKAFKSQKWRNVLTGEKRSQSDYTIGDPGQGVQEELNQRFQYRAIGVGLIAGFIASLAISAVILIVEKVTGIPVGSFYLVLMAALTASHHYSFDMIVSGSLLHFVAGSIIGLFMAMPLAIMRNKRLVSIKNIDRYSPVYGLVFGFALWSLVFMPTTFLLVLPFLANFENHVITQRDPTYHVTSFATSELLSMQNKIIVGALAFNMLYGLLAAIIIKSIYIKYCVGNTLLSKHDMKPLT